MIGTPIVPFAFPTADGDAGKPLIHDDVVGSRTFTWGQDIRTSASPTFAGATLSGLTASTLLTANGSKAIASLANATGYLYNDGAGALSYVSTAAPAAHNLLSTSHGDTLADAVVRGDILVGNSTPKWSRKAKGSAGQLVTFDANDVTYTTATYPATTTAYQIIHSTAANTVGESANLTFNPLTGLYVNGNLGIGTAPSTYNNAGNETVFDMSRTFTDATAGAEKRGFAPVYYWSPTGAGTISQNVFGIAAFLYTHASETMNNSGYLQGIYAAALHRSNSTIQRLAGLVASVGTWNGGSDTSGTVTELYGAFLSGQKTASSTITTAYGLRITGFSGSTVYDVSAEDATASNYFAGATGIGSSVPLGKLEVKQAQNTNAATFTNPHLKLTASSTTNTTGTTAITLAVSTTDNYGVSLAALRAGTGGTPSFSLRLHENSAAGTEMLRVNATGFGFGVTSISAYLHLKAGTTAASTSPLKFTSGSLMTAAEVGAVEFLTDKAYLTITTGTARKELTLNDAALTSGTTPVATTNGRLTDGLILASGTYSPTLTGVTNVTGSTTATCQYARVGSTVVVSGEIMVDPTAGGGATTVLGVSLPIASNFTSATQCGGTGCFIGTATRDCCNIVADSVNDRATIEWNANDDGNNYLAFCFQYLIA